MTGESIVCKLLSTGIKSGVNHNELYLSELRPKSSIGACNYLTLDLTPLLPSRRRSAKGRLRQDDVDFDHIQFPVLFVHHVNDPCPRAPYEGAIRISRKYPLIFVSGGLDRFTNRSWLRGKKPSMLNWTCPSSIRRCMRPFEPRNKTAMA
jgi:hypothetical protein